MIEYYDISGCYIVRPWAYHIWEVTRDAFDKEIKKLGVENSYFPMFVSKHRLEAEQDHVEGFSAEVAWVTKYGDSDLSEPIAIRPTSETIMYPAYAKWIRSHRDLPLLLNQWNTVVRWEFKQPTPFIRTREFLWQEGHTAHSSQKEAMDFVLTILNLYRKWYEDYLAVPVIPGEKSENERFAGGHATTTIETFIPTTGRAVQAATSHYLGQNFAKMFGIQYEDAAGNSQLVHQTSWGCTTRTLGVMVMVHGDDKGLVIPPRVVHTQVVIVPIIYKDSNLTQLEDQCKELMATLRKDGLRVKTDLRENYTPGWKFNHWETRGVPIRVELGPRDMEARQCRLVRRDNNAKEDVPWAELTPRVQAILEEIQHGLFNKAKTALDRGIVKCMTFDQVMPVLDAKKLVLAPWCGEAATEDEVKKETARLTEVSNALAAEKGIKSTFTGGMKTLCIPHEQPELPSGTKCFWTGKPASRWTLWGRSY
eukprot:GHVT01060010.1.p1 GENE.GHVT01060010.1~~GHVT01060010.1.p1  ORF type:complete len:479 (-),score=74.31 GHVT01060010.1:431-1867(-)